MRELDKSDTLMSGLDWMLISQHLPKPWPPEAAWADLYLFDWFETFTTSKPPGKVKLARRWGWSESRASVLIRRFRTDDADLHRGRGSAERIRRAYADVYRLLG